MRKDLKEYQEYYFGLIEEKKVQARSIEQQKIKVAKLTAELDEAEKRDEVLLAALRAENDSLEEVMRMYVKQIDSLNTINLRLETARQNAGAYYFNLADFVEPKIYYFHNTAYPLYSEYWRMYSIPESNILVTEGYSSEFVHFNTFTERYDSTSSTVVEHIRVSNSDSTYSAIGPTEVYRWNATEDCSYTLNFAPSDLNYGYTKQRKLAGIDSMEVLGKMTEVLRFQDKYSFFSEEEISLDIMQQSFYAKGYGLVRYLQFDEINKENETYILKAIYTEDEWQELQR